MEFLNGFLINFNLWRWSCACVGVNNWVIIHLCWPVTYNTLHEHTTSTLYFPLHVSAITKHHNQIYRTVCPLEFLFNYYLPFLCLCHATWAQNTRYIFILFYDWSQFLTAARKLLDMVFRTWRHQLVRASHACSMNCSIADNIPGLSRTLNCGHSVWHLESCLQLPVSDW